MSSYITLYASLDQFLDRLEARLSNIQAEFVLKIVYRFYVYLTLTFDPNVKGFKHLRHWLCCNLHSKSNHYAKMYNHHQTIKEEF